MGIEWRGRMSGANHTLSLRRPLAPAFKRDCVVVMSPLSAAKWRADHPVLCDDGG